jgi:dCTP deaminase
MMHSLEATLALAASHDGDPASATGGCDGILPYQAILQLRQDGVIVSDHDIGADQFQPASLDLRLGTVAYRVRASFLPGPRVTVMDRIRELDGYKIDLTVGAVLERGCVYVIPLLEAVALKGDLVGVANPKSSAGRLDILTRLITDRSAGFDQIERDYQGPLYVELAPRTFSIVVRTGSRLNQLRFRRGSSQVAHSELKALLERHLLIDPFTSDSVLRDGRVGVTIDLVGSGRGGLIGYRAQRHTDRIDIDKIKHYPASEFWEPLYNHRDGPLILDPDHFYILATKEKVAVPSGYAAEMVAYDTTVGEFRVHYAGFFDPGFGCDAGGLRSKAVLEVRSHEVPFMLEDGQTIGWLRYEKMAETPDRLYGADLGSNYQNQGLALAKQFRI